MGNRRWRRPERYDAERDRDARRRRPPDGTEPLERILRDGAADGSLRTVDPVEYATVLFNLVGWTYLHLRTGHGWPPGRAHSATLDVALNGLASA